MKILKELEDVKLVIVDLEVRLGEEVRSAPTLCAKYKGKIIPLNTAHDGRPILMKQDFDFPKAFKTAIGMSFISMISMEVTMNLTDYLLTGGAILTWWVIPIMLLVGFLTPWPYNYWRLKKFGIACH